MQVALKTNVNIEDFLDVSPWLLVIYGEFCAYAKRYDLPVIVTSMLDDAPGRKSLTHAEGRAIDISSRGWSKLHIARVKYHLNQKYGEIFGTSPRDRKPVVLVYHDAGTGFHFHLQVKRFEYIDYEFADE